jgi:sulfite reductase (NADPH) flavoprotein alpha-component
MDKDKILKLLKNDKKSPIELEGLPLSISQKQWLGGFLSGIQIQVEELGGLGNTGGKPLTILYGSQTGNSESMANEAAVAAKRHGLAPEVIDMSDITIENLVKSERILIVTSTYGEGEMPDNAQMLWDDISSENAPNFSNSFFSVLALGDTSYDGFCTAGKEWDRRLADLGAARVVDRVDCDVDYETPSMAWIENVIPIITAKGSQDMVTVSSSVKKETSKPKFDRKNPLDAVLLNKRMLSGDKSSKEIVHYEFSLGGSGETYLAGDALNIIPQNRPDLIDQLLSLFGNYPDNVTMDKLIHGLEIRTPSKELIQLVAEKSEDEELKRMVENGDNEAISDFLWGLDSYQLIKSYGSKKIGFIDFFNNCKPLSPRAYSISSSIKKHKNEVHLTIGSIRYNKHDRTQNGVTSTFLADLVNVGEKVKCYFSPNKQFKIPEEGDLNTIMVGPGTGIAPFRSFLEEREATKATGSNWLFFGDRNKEHDFIYRDEMEEMQKSGLLTKLDLAFSRDQAEKIYVQDKMIENGKEFFEWLEKGAYFYICGDAYRMAKDVDSALHEIIAKHGSMSGDKAAEYVTHLKKQKRYVRDVY